MSGFSQKLSGDWEKQLKQLEKMGKINFKKMHKQIGEALKSNVDLRFADQKSPDGVPWAPTQRGGQILTKTGTLSGSVSYEATDKEIEIGTNHVSARMHQFGGVVKAKKKKYLQFKTAKGWVKKKRIKIKARPFLGISNDDKSDIESIFKKTVQETNK